MVEVKLGLLCPRMCIKAPGIVVVLASRGQDSRNGDEPAQRCGVAGRSAINSRADAPDYDRVREFSTLSRSSRIHNSIILPSFKAADTKESGLRQGLY